MHDLAAWKRIFGAENAFGVDLALAPIAWEMLKDGEMSPLEFAIFTIVDFYTEYAGKGEWDGMDGDYVNSLSFTLKTPKKEIIQSIKSLKTKGLIEVEISDSTGFPVLFAKHLYGVGNNFKEKRKQ